MYRIKEKVQSLKGSWLGMSLAILIGLTAYGIKATTKSPIADPLLVAMIIGIILRTVVRFNDGAKNGFLFIPFVLIPIGIPLYAMKNLNFVKLSQIPISTMTLLVIVMLVYFIVILVLGKLLKQKKEITYLVATGSAICGASAIAITAPAVKAEPDDISVSLLAVAIAGIVALFVILPFCVTAFGITDKVFGELSGSVLQFTGFVKAAAKNTPYLSTTMSVEKVTVLALSIKASRYLGLLIAIPLFASLSRKKIYMSWILWIFLLAGIAGTIIYASNKVFYTENIVPTIKPAYNILWAIAMAAIGLNADIKKLLSNNGTKAIVMAFAGFFAATATFFIGLKVVQLF